jgi:c-di-GMP-binding flagellar brake protein YcgR
MPEPYEEKIQDAGSILSDVRYLIESRIPLQMEFPRSRFIWTTFILEIKDTDHESFLLIDNVKEFETGLASRPDAEIFMEFREKSGVPCLFRTRVIKCTPEGIWAEIPRLIQRIQKRQDFRIETPLGAEISFRRPAGKRESGRLQNISAGGAAFAIRRELDLTLGDVFQEVELKIPAGDRPVVFHIPEATVRRIHKDYFDEKSLIAIEFTDLIDPIRKDILAYVLRTQRESIRKIGR